MTQVYLNKNNTSNLTTFIYTTPTLSKITHSRRNQILQETMTFLGETSSQTIVNSRLNFIFPNGSITHNQYGVYFQSSTPIPIRVPNDRGFEMLKSRIHNTLQLTSDQHLDKIYYWQPFANAGNQFGFQSMQLKNDDDDVNTILMCNDQYPCVGPIELLCTILRTPDDILNLLQVTMTLLMMLCYITMVGETCHTNTTFWVTRSLEKIQKNLTFHRDVASMD